TYPLSTCRFLRPGSILGHRVRVAMKPVIAYILVIVLASPCFYLGAVLAAIPVAGCLARASEQFRGVVAGVFSGFGGVAASVALGYFVFRSMFDSSAFGLFPLLAATIPLIFPVRSDLAKSQLLFNDAAKLREVLQSQSGTVQEKENIVKNMGTMAMAVGCKFRVIGAAIGVILAFLWLFFWHKNAA
ncbi:MAG TPA: hypothetical protein VMH87_10045, partial [Pseudomonadales bacterium]|nr:hypothetical protein [Pseudomonadales bacterium]